MAQTRINRYNDYLKQHQLKTRLQKKGLALSLTSLAAFASIGLVANTTHSDSLSLTHLQASADTTATTGTIGTVPYSYDTSTNTLTFTGGGSFQTSSGGGTDVQISSLFPNVAHIVFTQPVTSGMGLGLLFAHLTSLKNFTGLDKLDTSQLTAMDDMFSDDSSLTSIDLSHFNTSNVTSMGSTFSGCSSLTSLDLSSFNTNKLETLVGTFSGCTSLSYLDLSNFNFANQYFSGSGALSNVGNGKTFYLKLPGQKTMTIGDALQGSTYTSVTPIDEANGGTLADPKGVSMTIQQFAFALADGNITNTEWYLLGTAGQNTVVNQEKIVKRTINYQDASGNSLSDQPATVQELKYTRTQTTDPIGNVTYSNWTPEVSGTSQFDAVDVPQTVDNKYANPKVNGAAVTSIAAETPTLDNTLNEQDETINVVYSESAVTPTSSQNSANNTTNTNGESSTSATNATSTDSASSTNKSTDSESNQATDSNSKNTSSTNTQDQTSNLPATGSRVEKNSAVYLSLFAVIASLVAYFATKRNK